MRGDHSADTNAHRIILSVDTASNFITDVLESAMTKTFHSAISSRENLFFSLQRVGNDSRRIFELVDRATNVVSGKKTMNSTSFLLENFAVKLSEEFSKDIKNS